MTVFRTIVNPQKASNNITHETPVMILGSCFAENIGNKLTKFKFNTDVNPFGVIYNPLSVAKSLELLLENKPLKEDILIQHNEYWHSFYHHGKFSSKDKETCLLHINEQIQVSATFLENTNYLILTFGTAWAYFYNNGIVSNCHKIPATQFERRLLEINEIVQLYTELLTQIKQQNKTIEIILTVSPIRHLKDGAHGNQISKSTLLMAVNELCKKGLSSYFPSYEIMLDDLRDYRFYSADMVHPSDMAIEYIFEKFADCYFNDETKSLNSEIKKITDAANHRPIDIDSKAHKNFVGNILEKIRELHKTQPKLDFSREIAYFENLI